MAITWGEVLKWGEDCEFDAEDVVSIDDGGLCLEAFGCAEDGQEVHYYLEVGGNDLDDLEEEE